MEIVKKKTLSEAFSVYLDRRMTTNSFVGNHKWIPMGSYWK